jgi:hypothetical protein
VQWRNFAKVLDRAKLACKNSGYDVPNHFAVVSKIIEAGATSKPVVNFMAHPLCLLLKKRPNKLMLDE